MKQDRPGPTIPPDDQRPRIVAEQRTRNPAKVRARITAPRFD
jgi:hypothetical protein